MKKWGNKILKVISADSEAFSLKLKFSDGVTRYLNLTEFFRKPSGLTAEILAGDMFDKCFVESGALAWPNGLELCPDALLRMAPKKTPRHRAA